MITMTHLMMMMMMMMLLLLLILLIYNSNLYVFILTHLWKFLRMMLRFAVTFPAATVVSLYRSWLKTF